MVHFSLVHRNKMVNVSSLFFEIYTFLALTLHKPVNSRILFLKKSPYDGRNFFFSTSKIVSHSSRLNAIVHVATQSFFLYCFFEDVGCSTYKISTFPRSITSLGTKLIGSGRVYLFLQEIRKGKVLQITGRFNRLN